MLWQLIYNTIYDTEFIKILVNGSNVPMHVMFLCWSIQFKGARELPWTTR